MLQGTRSKSNTYNDYREIPDKKYYIEDPKAEERFGCIGNDAHDHNKQLYFTLIHIPESHNVIVQCCQCLQVYSLGNIEGLIIREL